MSPAELAEFRRHVPPGEMAEFARQALRAALAREAG
jgi:hypothetical protein